MFAVELPVVGMRLSGECFHLGGWWWGQGEETLEKRTVAIGPL